MQAAFYSAACFYKRSEYPAYPLRVSALHYCNNTDKQKDKTQKLNKKQATVRICPGGRFCYLIIRSAIVMPSKKSLMSLSSFVHIARVRHEPAFSHGSFQAVSPALSVRALDKPSFRERCHNAFEIFKREFFALGNLLERDKSAVLFIFGKIRHDAQGVSAAA